jgi:drug/metabolite transporter (DMT)-like permease
MPSPKKGFPIAITATLFLATTAIFIGYLTRIQQMAPLLVALWRDILVCAVLGPALFLIRRSLLHLERRNLCFFILFGLVMAVFNAVWALSVKLNGAAVATVLAYGSTGFTALLGRWVFKERLDVPKIAAVILSLGGCVLVSNAYDPGMWNINPQGIVFGVLTALLYAVYSLMGKESSRRGINSWRSLFFAFALAALFLIVINVIPGLPGSVGNLGGLLPILPAAGWWLLAGLAVVSILGFGLYILAMNYLQASVTNLVATLEPLLTAILAYILLGERMTLVQGVGGVLIVLGLLIVRLSEREA